MTSVRLRNTVPFPHFDQLDEAREIIRREADALYDVSDRMNATFCEAVDLLLGCRGRVIVTGIGKAGLIGMKISATLSSTGTGSQFLHPAEAIHGDLGCLGADDIVLALSNSGETEEVNRLLAPLAQLNVPVIAITTTAYSTLGSGAQVTIELGHLSEVGVHGLAPSTSTTAMLALGDALALVTSRRKNFTPRDFAQRHPGGSLGRKLTAVGDLMRSVDHVRVASETATVREVFSSLSHPGRRTGAVMLIDARGRLSGLFTDSDLARLLEQRCDHQLDQPIRGVMTRSPLTVPPEATLAEVIDILSGRKISELPVVDDEGRPLGLIDITDVIGCLPHAEPEQNSPEHARGLRAAS